MGKQNVQAEKVYYYCKQCLKCNGPLENAHTLLKKVTTVFIQTCIKKYLHLHTLLFKFFYYNSKHDFILA